jgi:hypothetical protein
MSVESIEDVAQRLYGLLPEDFTSARDLAAREARAAGDRATAKAISGLRRPSLAAWLVNALMRHRPAEVEQLLTLGEALRSAQFGFAGDEMRQLSRQRQQLIAAVGRQARALARELGHPVSDDVGQEVEATLGAAMADPDVAEAVRSGRLTSPTSYAGLGAPETEASAGPPRLAAVPTTPPAEAPRRPRKGDDAESARRREEQRREEERRREDERRAAELEQARQEAQEAQQAWEDAVETARAGQRRHDDAERAVTEARQRIDDLQEQLQRAEQALGASTRDERALRRERDAAERVAELAGRAAQRARARVEQLEPRH